jgi:hypothetical protein
MSSTKRWQADWIALPRVMLAARCSKPVRSGKGEKASPAFWHRVERKQFLYNHLVDQ